MLHVFVSAADDDDPAGRDRAAPFPATRHECSTTTAHPVPAGTAGRLAVKGPTGCRYLADARQSVYVQNGWNLTGDTFIQDADGYFYYQARNDDMIVSSGYNIAGPEVEEALLAHDAVLECCVVGQPDPLRGQVVTAYVVLEDGVAGDDMLIDALQSFVKATDRAVQVPARSQFRVQPAAHEHRQGAALCAASRQPGQGACVKIAVIGGGPAGLYFAALTKQLAAAHSITVWERNASDDTFGFGVVFSDETLGGIEHADERVYAQMQREFARWDDIDVHFRGQVLTSGGHGFAAMSRRRLLQILQERCADLGVDLRFGSPAPDVGELAATHDLVIACDGVNSAVRSRYSATFSPTLDARHCKYMWLGTSKVFEAFKFYVCETPHGVMQIHGYPYDATGSTFIVEMNDSVWRQAGFDAFADRPFAPGESDEKSVEVLKELFADILDGHDVMVNNSKWVNFTTVRNEQWRHENIVLMGDAAHTAHFSIGSGTKLAMEDALALAACLHEHARYRLGARGVRTRAASGRVVHPTRGPSQPRMVREPRPVHESGPTAVRVQHHDPQPAGHV